MIYTSYFSNPALKGSSLRLVSIARGNPRGWHGERYERLAPTWAMLKMPEAEYYRLYDEILGKLNVMEVGNELDGSVLLCWERDAKSCHRSYVGKWLAAAGFEVQELGRG